MQNKTKVTATESGAVIVVSENNPNFGHIRVQQERVIFDNGWARAKVISAFIPGPIEDLKKLNWVSGQEVEGKIIEKESLKPFNSKQPERDFKVAGKTGIICTIDGQPIYRKTIYTTNLAALDERIAHTNKEDIRLAFDALKEQEAEVSGKEKEFSL